MTLRYRRGGSFPERATQRLQGQNGPCLLGSPTRDQPFVAEAGGVRARRATTISR